MNKLKYLSLKLCRFENISGKLTWTSHFYRITKNSIQNTTHGTGTQHIKKNQQVL